MRLKILQYNLLRLNNQPGKQIPAMHRFFEANLEKKPDIMLWQEVKGRKDDKSPERVMAALGGYHAIYTNKKGGKEGEGNAVLSRWPIVRSYYFTLKSSALLDTKRLMLVADIDVPGVGLVRAASLHAAWARWMDGVREKQVKECLGHLDDLQRAQPAVATFFGGDFNDTLSSDAVKQVYFPQTPHRIRYTTNNNPLTKTFKARRRIDFIFAGAISLGRTPTFVSEQALFDKGELKMSDHSAVLQEFEL